MLPRIGGRLLVESNCDNNVYRRKVCIGGIDGNRQIRWVQKIGTIVEPTYRRK